ncbi:MAG: TATA-box-binding family protein [Halobacteriota archaeon]
MRIVNIVAVAVVEGPFDLVLLENRIKNAELSPRAPWVKLRLAPEDYYVAFHRSGKFMITGIQNFELIDALVTRVLELLKQGGIDVKLESVTVHNIVVVDKVDLHMTLEHLVASLGDAPVSYEPEQFPALYYKDDDGISYTLFSSGKLIAQGANDVETARKGIERFKAMVTS